MAENPSGENIVKVWMNHTIEDAIVVIEKAVKPITLQTVNSCWGTLCPHAVHDLTGCTTEPVMGIMKEIADMAQRQGRGLKIYGSWRNSRASRHHTRGINRRRLLLKPENI